MSVEAQPLFASASRYRFIPALFHNAPPFPFELEKHIRREIVEKNLTCSILLNQPFTWGFNKEGYRRETIVVII